MVVVAAVAPRFNSTSERRPLVPSCRLCSRACSQGGHGERVARWRESWRPLAGVSLLGSPCWHPLAGVPLLAEAMPLCRAGAWLFLCLMQHPSRPPNLLCFGVSHMAVTSPVRNWAGWTSHMHFDPHMYIGPCMHIDPRMLVCASSYRLGSKKKKI